MNPEDNTPVNNISFSATRRGFSAFYMDELGSLEAVTSLYKTKKKENIKVAFHKLLIYKEKAFVKISIISVIRVIRG